jgi:hypothetical protein
MLKHKMGQSSPFHVEEIALSLTHHARCTPYLARLQNYAAIHAWPGIVSRATDILSAY